MLVFLKKSQRHSQVFQEFHRLFLSLACRALDRLLLEQILASHSLVDGTSELPDLGHCVADDY